MPLRLALVVGCSERYIVHARLISFDTNNLVLVLRGDFRLVMRNARNYHPIAEDR